MIQKLHRGMSGVPADLAREGKPIPMNSRGGIHFFPGNIANFAMYGDQDIEGENRGDERGYGSEGGVIIEVQISLEEKDGWVYPEVGWAFSWEGEDIPDEEEGVTLEDQEVLKREVKYLGTDELYFLRLPKEAIGYFHIVSLKPVVKYKIVYDYMKNEWKDPVAQNSYQQLKELSKELQKAQEPERYNSIWEQINKLASLADSLDSKGLYREANEVDEIMKKIR